MILADEMAQLKFANPIEIVVLLLGYFVFFNHFAIALVEPGSLLYVAIKQSVLLK